MPQDNDDFYTSISLSPGTDQLDDHIQGRSVEGSYYTSMQGLTQNGREKNALPLPVQAGTRVAFLHNLGSVLSYEYVPDEGLGGTVIMVRTADGDCTYQGDNVFVKWDDGAFLPTHRHHLQALSSLDKQASSFVMRTSNFGDLAALFATTDKSSELVHKSTKDLWSFEEDDGEFVISRLFDDGGDPLHA